jgi:hypothetical protein
MVLPSSSMVRILKSTPMVEMYDSVYVSSAARANEEGRENVGQTPTDVRGAAGAARPAGDAPARTEAEQQAALADTAVADEEQLEEEVAAGEEERRELRVRSKLRRERQPARPPDVGSAAAARAGLPPATPAPGTPGRGLTSRGRPRAHARAAAGAPGSPERDDDDPRERAPIRRARRALRNGGGRRAFCSVVIPARPVGGVGWEGLGGSLTTRSSCRRRVWEM